MNTTNEQSGKSMARRSFVKGVAGIGGVLLTTATGAYPAAAQGEPPKNFVFRTRPITAKELVVELCEALQLIDGCY